MSDVDQIEYVYTYGMDEDEVEARLREETSGVLSLADGGRAYAVPISYAYRDGRLFLRLGGTEGSEKMAFVETTVEACFLLYGIETSDRSWSVVARGELRELTVEEREAFDATEINVSFDPLRVFGEPIDELDVSVFELRIDSITGRRTGN